MQGLLTKFYHRRVANIAKGIDLVPENTINVYDLIKGANPEQKQKVKKVMDEWKAGTLHSGSKKGPKVTNYKQALVVALSESGLAKAEDLKELIPEHERLVGVLKHGDKKDREKEAKTQSKELKTYKKEVEKGGDAVEAMSKKKCKHGILLSKCEKCNKDTLEKDMEMGSGDADGVEASVEKAFVDLLEKGGEGSRGGKVIGHTKSGKPIYENASHPSHEDFSYKEHEEARQLHEKKAFKHNETKNNSGLPRAKRMAAAQKEIHHKKQADTHVDIAHEKKKEAHGGGNVMKELEKYHEEDPEKFFEVVSKHYEPEDDGESEHTMFENLNKHSKLGKIREELAKKFKKSLDDIDQAFEGLVGTLDPIEKAMEDVLSKGGKGSNKAGRKIGTTRSGKTVHVFKEAQDYKDFEPVDHLEAHKIHLHHAHKVTGVAAVNSRIRAHDHEDLARIKQAQKEQAELEANNAAAQKQADGGKQTKSLNPRAKIPRPIPPKHPA